MKKTIITIAVIVLVVALFIFIGINKESIGVIFSGQKIYTQEQYDENYEKGYQEAKTNADNYLEQLEYYKNIAQDYETKIKIIPELQNKVKVLELEITRLNNYIDINLDNENALNLRIAELEKTIQDYKDYISSLNLGSEVVVTFEVDGKVHSIQTLNKSDYVTVEDPTSTEYLIFNYWTVNGERVDLSTYSVTENTTFIANLTYKYDVIFIVDGVNYSVQTIEKDTTPVLPTEPTKEDYAFVGWSVNGVDVVEPETIKVTETTKYIAVFSELHSVVFMSEGEIYNSQILKDGSNIVIPDNPIKTGWKFLGWSENGTTIIDINSVAVYNDIVYTAIFGCILDGDYVFYAYDIDTEQFGGVAVCLNFSNGIMTITEEQLISSTRDYLTVNYDSDTFTLTFSYIFKGDYGDITANYSYVFDYFNEKFINTSSETNWSGAGFELSTTDEFFEKYAN